MERVKRRWWTRAVSLLAAVIILGAVISGLFQLAVLTLPSYRADLSAWITRVANRPVQIGGVNLGWRGIEPRLDLDDITLFSEDGNESLSLDRLSLGFSVFRLLTGDVFPDRLELAGVSLLVEQDAAGKWSIAGFTPADPATSRQDWSRDLARFRHLRLRNCTIEIRSAPGGSARFAGLPRQLRVATLDVDQSDDDFEFDGRLLLPVTHGSTVEVSGDFDGRLAEPAGWRGDFELEFASLRPQGWLAPLLQAGVQIGAENVDLAVAGRVEAGALRSAELELESDALLLARGGKAERAASARLRAALRGEAQGWAIELAELSIGGERQARGQLHWRRNGSSQELDVDADELRLGRLAPWLGIWRQAPAALTPLARASGGLRNLVVRLRRNGDAAPRFSATARLEQLALAADAHLGFAQLSGELSATESGGELRVGDVPFQLMLPSALAQPAAFDALRLQAQWRRTADSWRISVPEFGWKIASTQGSGKLGIDVYDNRDRPPLVDLQARFTGDDVNAIKPYIPTHWPQPLRDWLARALVRGRVTRGQLAIHGPITDFPFHKRPTGNWQLDLDAAGVNLAFAPDWPAIDNAAAHLRFAGNGLKIDAQSARIGGAKIDRASARFDDFNEGLLQIEASASGDIARFYDYLDQTPLRKRLSALLEQTRASGDAQLDLRLDLPVHHLHDTGVDGSIALSDVQMFYSKLEQPIGGIFGEIHFDTQGVSGDSISARFEDLPLAVRIVPRAGTHGVVVADFPFAPNADGVGASQFIPAQLRAAMQGESRWRAELPIQDQGSALMLSSDLRGTAVDLPEPLGKSAEAAAPIGVRIGSDAAAPLRVDLTYAQRLGADLAFAAADKPADSGAAGNGGLQLQGLHARFGVGAAPRAVRGSYLVDGHADTLDIAAWMGLLSGQSSGTAAGNGGLRIDSIDLEAEHLRWRHQLIGATRLRYQPRSNGWHVDLSGEGAGGTLDFSGPAPGRLQARLDHVSSIPKAPPGELPDASAEAAAAAQELREPPLNPASWPEFDIIANRISGNNADLGRLELRSARINGGQKIEQLTVGGGIVDFTASGAWRRLDGRSSAELRYQLRSRDFEAVLKALDYAPNLGAQKFESHGELKWAPSPTGLVWQVASGRVDLDAQDGQLRAVKPGASRVLGLINFYALPRRLTLNFSDVVDEGLGFDSVRGHFDLGGGAAVTDDLEVRSPSLRMELRGRIGLAARDYDQRVTVYPGVSSGLTIGATVLGGPAIGALVLLAQEVFDRPLDQLTQLTYAVSGSWDNPKVERVEARSAPRQPAPEKKR